MKVYKVIKETKANRNKVVLETNDRKEAFDKFDELIEKEWKANFYILNTVRNRYVADRIVFYN